MARGIDPDLIPEIPNLELERQLWDAQLFHIAGIDEAGRGPLAGPVVVAAIILPPERKVILELSGVRDSKQMTSSQRESWTSRIQECALTVGVGQASPKEIDALRIVPATQLAAQRALAALSIEPQHLLLDYLFLENISIPQTSLVKGDARSLSIAAASVLAKTSRDALMIELDEKYPGYALAKNKGYGTKAHRQAIVKLGPSPIHRMSFAPIKDSGKSSW